MWLTVSDGLCSTAESKPVLFGENSTSGCLLPVSRQDLTRCDLLRSVAQPKVMFDPLTGICIEVKYQVFDRF